MANARLFFWRINVKTFFTLLQILSTELERIAGEDANIIDASKKISVVSRRVLPALRHYSSWLLCVYHLLVAVQKKGNESPLPVQIREFWKVYANALTLLTSLFDVVQLPEIDYLLEEDEETLGFAPLAKDASSRRYLDANGAQKPRMDEPGLERSHPSIEMLYRIREFVIDGLDLVVSNKIPIALVDSESGKSFIYREEGLPPHFFSDPHIHRHTLSSTRIEREDIEQATSGLSDPAVDARSTVDEGSSASVSADMYRIVEGVERLVNDAAPEQLPFLDGGGGGGPPTPQGMTGAPFQDLNTAAGNHRSNTPMAPPGLYPPIRNGQPLAQAYTQRPALPSIPSIWNTGFSPQVADAPSPRTPPGLGQGQLSDNIGRSVPGYTRVVPNSFGQSARSMSSSWLPPSTGQAFSPWKGDAFDPYGSHPGAGSSLMNTSWANNAFVSSSIPSEVDYPVSGFNGRRTASQVGAIGQTPSYGQGG